MKFIKQANAHKPEEGIYGDCHRTCMSILLGLERDSVPNFGEHFNDHIAWDKSVREFLEPMGISELANAYACTLEELFSFHTNINKGIPFILGGFSKTGCNHSVVCDNTGILWDPSQNNSGIIGPCDDGYYWTYHYVRLAT